ncbi:hypothetical protein JM93_00616 [Roseibium hamelinense]|uniref:Uncharacterized protein n=1 Tax=Roseibium hamelinense TaxID=150831 RepID=A0A562THL8_9HYPH|nr:hypothetical protein [Roseibium hamelinense]MTI45755.1 hypothetical protein [Roseibium hamelinense]TWI93062.1 hypothetical protein JM93_00616 [Roseibium hamelinense]
MKSLIVSGLLIAAGTSGVSASGIPSVGDFYLIARTDAGMFRSSHKIFKRPSRGLHEVVYCNRTYWVRPYTVAWSEIQVEGGWHVRVEYNQGKGWFPICEDPERQVSLKDIGIDLNPREVAYDTGDQSSGASRFGEIGRTFRALNGSSATTDANKTDATANR